MRWQGPLCFYGQLQAPLVASDLFPSTTAKGCHNKSPTRVRWLAATANVDAYPADVAVSPPASQQKQPQKRAKNAADVVVERATVADIEAIQRCNRASLPENYADCFYERHMANWPALSFVAREDSAVVGYVLGRLESEREAFLLDGESSPLKCGHITSLAVSEGHRGKGVARTLMAAVHVAMRSSYRVTRSRLHVRSSNHPALRLYASLGYTIHSVINAYYADGEAAYLMAATFSTTTTTTGGDDGGDDGGSSPS
mmetsp:Transcript_12878/g.38870  ORF Transcript_12878/g.38870 Transcript_12878/m.38870 type:complete len:256 (+) Transcript_12878:112-879(+)